MPVSALSSRHLGATLLLLALGLAASPARSAAPPPVVDFFRHPAVLEPSLSPDGRTLVYISVDRDDHLVIQITDLEQNTAHALQVVAQSTYPLFWAGNDHLILRSRLAGHSVLDVRRRKATAFSMNDWNMEALSARKSDPDLLNVWYHRWGDNGRVGPAVINLRRIPSGFAGQTQRQYNVERWLDHPAGENIAGYYDDAGDFRLTYVYRDKILRPMYRATENAEWRELSVHPLHDGFIDFSADPDVLYFTHSGPEDMTAGVYEYHVSTQSWGERLFADADYAMEDASFLTVDGRLLGLSYHGAKLQNHWFDDALAAAQRELDQKLPGRINEVIERSDDGRVLLVSSIADRLSPQTSLYYPETKTLRALPPSRPWLQPEHLRPMQIVQWRARDGLPLQGYLTFPAPRADGAKPPLVVLPHGGPSARDTWGFDETVQFLASRGYAVFQPNYRGSSGFTRDVSVAPQFDYRAMHNDVTDGVKSLQRSGAIDPERVAIMGWSFGGYLSLCGAAFEPDLYRCALPLAGVFDWQTLIQQSSRKRHARFRHDFLRQQLGDPENQREKFDAISPLRHVDQVRIPIFVSHGRQDEVVDIEQSKALVQRLKQHNKVVETYFPDLEGHGYFRLKNTVELHQRIEAFLARHL